MASPGGTIGVGGRKLARRVIIVNWINVNRGE